MSLSLHYQRVGTGPPLLILHGLFGSGTNWRSIARTLGEQWDVFLPDARNHGASPHARGMSYPLLAEDALAFMDQRELERVDLIGHSMGGKTAMWLALAHPQRIRRLMVVDIAPGASGSNHGPLLDLMRAMPVHRMRRRSEAEEALAQQVPDAGLRAFVVQNLVSRDDGLAWRLNLEAIADALPDLVGFPQPSPPRRFEGPTLFLRGARSDYVGEGDEAAIRALFPGARVETVPDAGHWPHAEQPAAFLRLTKAFLGGEGD